MGPISDVEKRVKEISRKTRRKYSAEVGVLRSENRHLKQLYADLALKNDMLKKISPDSDRE